MDWTIVVSVLVALLLWPLAVAGLMLAVMLPAVLVVRKRSQRMMAGIMSVCMNQFQSMMAGMQPETVGPGSQEWLTSGQQPHGCGCDLCVGTATREEVQHDGGR